MEFVYDGQPVGVKHIVDTERCSGCRRCIKVCDEDVWRWDENLHAAIPKYIGECVHCYKCEMACLNNCIDIIPTSMIKHDPLLG